MLTLLQSLDVANRQLRSNEPNDIDALQTNLGATIRHWRKKLGITQEELAWRSDLHRTYIADIERGGRNITLRSIAHLAAALQVTVQSLVSQAEEPVSGEVKPNRPAVAKAMGEVLLVEDNPADVDLTLRAFKRAKFANPVRVARDGEEALATLFGDGADAKAKAPPLPQLVLLDLNLPKVSGLDVLRRLKEHPLTRDIPVVVLTISQHDRNIIECGRLGAENYIVKPVSFDSFCRVASKFSMRWALLTPGATCPAVSL